MAASATQQQPKADAGTETTVSSEEKKAWKELITGAQPFINRTWSLGGLAIAETILGGVILLPIRLVMVAFTGIALLIVCGIGTAGLAGDDLSKPLPWWRKVLIYPVKPLLRVVLFCLSIHWITIKGKQADKKVAPILIANHLSWVEPLALVAMTGGTPVSARKNVKLPVISSCLIALQALLVDRKEAEDLAKDKKAAANAKKSAGDATAVTVNASGAQQPAAEGMKANHASVRADICNRAKDEGFPPVLIFPEGTCTNGTAVISFKTGAFAPGLTVQPVLVVFPWAETHMDPSWVTAGPDLMGIAWRLISRIHTPMELHFLQPYTPSPAEVANPRIYAANVQRFMAAALGVRMSQHSYEDVLLSAIAAKAGFPVEKAVVEFEMLRSSLNVDAKVAHAYLERFIAADKEKTGRINFEQFKTIFSRRIVEDSASSTAPAPAVITDGAAADVAETAAVKAGGVKVETPAAEQPAAQAQQGSTPVVDAAVSTPAAAATAGGNVAATPSASSDASGPAAQAVSTTSDAAAGDASAFVLEVAPSAVVDTGASAPSSVAAASEQPIVAPTEPAVAFVLPPAPSADASAAAPAPTAEQTTAGASASSFPAAIVVLPPPGGDEPSPSPSPTNATADAAVGSVGVEAGPAAHTEILKLPLAKPSSQPDERNNANDEEDDDEDEGAGFLAKEKQRQQQKAAEKAPSMPPKKQQQQQQQQPELTVTLKPAVTDDATGTGADDTIVKVTTDTPTSPTTGSSSKPDMDATREAELQELFNLLDVDECGTLDFRELLVGLTIINLYGKSPDEQSMQQIFNVLDPQGKGRVTKAQLQSAFRHVWPNMTDEALEEAFQQSGEQSTDGKITAQEFFTWVKTRPELMGQSMKDGWVKFSGGLSYLASGVSSWAQSLATAASNAAAGVRSAAAGTDKAKAGKTA